MNTISVDIKESELNNFDELSNINLSSFVYIKQKDILRNYPFTLYKQRMFGDHMVTIQIPIQYYLLFLEHNLVK